MHFLRKDTFTRPLPKNVNILKHQMTVDVILFQKLYPMWHA